LLVEELADLHEVMAAIMAVSGITHDEIAGAGLRVYR
jgi:predicted house-cleaning noncanonical NTP pyrophosphatase (MazG superfamily)